MLFLEELFSAAREIDKIIEEKNKKWRNFNKNRKL